METDTPAELRAQIEKLKADLEKARHVNTLLAKSASVEPITNTPLSGLLGGIISALHETAIVGFDRDGNYLFAWSDEKTKGFDEICSSKLVGLNVSDVYSNEIATNTLAQLATIFETGIPVRGIVKHVTPIGSRWHDSRLAPMRNEDGEITAAVAIIIDVTDRLFAEAKSKESAILYQTLFEQISDPIVIHRDGAPFMANSAAYAFLGTSDPDSLNGKTILDFAHPDHKEAIQERLDLMAKGTNTHLPSMEYLLVLPDGREAWIETTGRLIQIEERPAFLSIFRDITQRRAIEDSRRKFERRIQQQQMQESLAVLAAGLAHDFNNLMMGVLGNASLLRRRFNDDDTGIEKIRRIEDAATAAADLTRKLRAYVGAEQPDYSFVNLSELVKNTVELLHSTLSPRIEFCFEIEEDVPSVWVDAAQIRQVMMNLVVNASEAIGSRAGVLTLGAKTIDAERSLLDRAINSDPVSSGRYIELSVKDTGEGISPDIVKKIFNPFFSTKFIGRGLGLAAVVGIVKAHRGAVIVDSEEGKGTTFRVLIPPNSSYIQPDTPTVRSATMRPSKGKGVILLAEDESIVADTVSSALNEYGFETIVAKNGSAAVDEFVAQSGNFTAAIIDMTMPKMAGPEVIRTIRQIRPNLRVFVTSGFPKRDCEANLGDIRVSGFFQKPYRPDELILALTEE